MTLVRIEPQRYADGAEALQAIERRLHAHLDSAITQLRGCGNMAGNDRGGEQFAESYDSSAIGALIAAQTYVETLRTLARIFNACGLAHTSAEWAASGSTFKPAGFRDPGALALNRYMHIPSATGGTHLSVPGLELVLDFLGSMVWPDADIDKLRKAGAAWQQLAGDFRAAARDVRAAKLILDGQLSPEIPTLRMNLDDFAAAMEGFADKLDGSESLSHACTAYADHVHEAHESSKHMLRDLLIEIGVTVGVGVALSFVTFGVAAGVSAGAAAAEAAVTGARVAGVLARLLARAADVALKLKRMLDALNRMRTLSKFLFAVSRDGIAGYITARLDSDDTDPGIAAVANAAAGGLGSLFTSIRFVDKAGNFRSFDNFAGNLFGGMGEGAIEYGVSGALSNEDLSVLGFAGSIAVGGTMGGIGHGVEAVTGSVTGKGPSVEAPHIDTPNVGGGVGGGASVDGGLSMHMDAAPTTSGTSPGGVSVTPGAGGHVDVHVPVATELAGPGLAPHSPSATSIDGPSVDGPNADPAGVQGPAVDGPTVDGPTIDGQSDGGGVPDEHAAAQPADPTSPQADVDAAPPATTQPGPSLSTTQGLASGAGPHGPSAPGADAQASNAEAASVVDSVPDAHSTPEGSTGPEGATPDGATTDGATNDGATTDGATTTHTSAESASDPMGDRDPQVDGDEGPGPGGDGTAVPASAAAPHDAPQFERFMYEFDGVEHLSRPMPPLPELPRDLIDRGFTPGDLAHVYETSTHNLDGSTSTAVLGRFDPANPSGSYQTIAANKGDAYFSLDSADWNGIKDAFDLTNDDMFEVLNTPFLDEIAARRMDVEFTHSPLEAPSSSALRQEYDYLKGKYGYVFDEQTMTMRLPVP